MIDRHCYQLTDFKQTHRIVLVHVVTASRTSWRIMRTSATEARVPAPVRDTDWVANRSRGARTFPARSLRHIPPTPTRQSRALPRAVGDPAVYRA